MRKIFPPKKVKGRGYWCDKCGFLVNERGEKIFANIWPADKLILYRGKWLCPEHYAQALRTSYKKEWQMYELENYIQDEQVPWFINIDSKE